MSGETAIDFQPLDLADLDASEAMTSLVRQATSLRASDLFFLTNEESVSLQVRQMGRMRPLATLPREAGRHLISYLKAEAGIDIAERRRPQEGRVIFQVANRTVDLRINIIPTLYGEDVAMRILDREVGLRTIDALGLSRQEQNALLNLLGSPSGLILVTGPTGTGKTTTLYSCLQHLCDGTRKINTLEDPIEYQLAGIRQSQVNSKLDVDFSDLLRNIMRQAPDVIMVGEIRDEQTATTAVRAANSGHLVLATLHAPVAASAVQSMRALGVNPYFLASSLLGVVAQRLLRKLCAQCQQPYDISESQGTFEPIKSLLEPGQGKVIYGPLGCPQCNNQGYDGRIGVFEILTLNQSLRQLVQNQAPAAEIQAAAIAKGMIEFKRSAMLKVAQGQTSMEEVLRELPAEYLGID